MRVWIDGADSVRLTQRDFVAQGGEATVYAKGPTAFKIYHDPTRMPPEGKLRELARIHHPCVLVPRQLLRNRQAEPVGYTMPHVAGATTLCQLVPRAFRDRRGVQSQDIRALVQSLRQGVQHVHEAGAVVVDLNEMNLLVRPPWRQVFFIDVDSYQTEHYPATALMDSVRDRQSTDGYSTATDWFSFAIVSFMLFVGIHPYRGKHPTVKGLDARMRANLSVLDSQVRLPAAAYPLQSIPDGYRQWYERVLQGGHREPPPERVGAPCTSVARPVHARPVAAQVRIVERARLDGTITAAWSHGSRLVVRTERSLWVDGQRAAAAAVAATGLCFTALQARPVGLRCHDGGLVLTDVPSGNRCELVLAASDVAMSAGQAHLKVRDRVLRLHPTMVGSQLLASTASAAQVLEHASALHDGVVMQRMLGTTYGSLLHGAHAVQARLPELDAYRVLDARFEGGVLMVLGRQGERFDRLVFRFAPPDFGTYDCRVETGVEHAGLNFVVLDRGLCVCLDGTDGLEVFAARPGGTALRRIADAGVGGDAQLLHRQGQVWFTRGDCLCSLSLTEGGRAAQ